MKKLFLLLLKFYQLALSPFFGDCCRFEPSCSEYCRQAIEKLGLLKGIYLALKRIGKCHPFHPGGKDPIP